MKPQQLFDYHLKASKVAAPAIGEEPGGYILLPRRNVCPGEALPFDVYLKFKLPEHPQPQFILAVPQGVAFAEDWHRRLAEMEINWLYYAQEDEGRVLEYLDGYLESVLPDEALETQEKVALLYDTTLIWIRNFFATTQVEPTAQLQRAMRLMDSLFSLGTGKDLYYRPILEMRRHDHFLYNHSLNICFLGMAFVSHLGWEAGKARDFGLGAMLHDIGLTQMRKENSGLNHGLQDDALNPITQHPVVGFRILSKFPQLRREVKKMALQHHENGDGSGYPTGLKLTAIDPWARILRILDHYDSLSGQSRRRPLSPQEALLDMCALQGNKIFDMHFLMAFIKFLGKI